jgi:hypothetical protein
MGAEEKEGWEKKARKDKARYEVEKAMYKGPWKIPANKRTPKDPTAPKRPMSAFLAFSNKRRAALKREHQDATNADLSKMLSVSWKEAPDDLRKRYMEEEAGLRAHYKVEMGKWRKKVAEEKKLERQEREAMAMQQAEARANNEGNVVPLAVTAADPRQFARTAGDPNMGGAAGGQQQPQETNSGGMGPNGGGMGPNGAGGQGGMYGNPYGMGGGQFGELGNYGGMPPAAGPGGYGNLMSGNPFGSQSLMGGQSAQQQLLSQLFSKFSCIRHCLS